MFSTMPITPRYSLTLELPTSLHVLSLSTHKEENQNKLEQIRQENAKTNEERNKKNPIEYHTVYFLLVRFLVLETISSLYIRLQ